MHAYVTSDFRLVNVVQNSHSAKPLLYKITGVWGNHEGSMLLWIPDPGPLRRRGRGFRRNLPPTLRARVLGGAGLDRHRLPRLHASSPRTPSSGSFRRRLDGRDLNPLLQDPGLAFHPPMLYTGYVGFSMAFSFAIAALDRRPGRRRLGALGAALDPGFAWMPS